MRPLQGIRVLDFSRVVAGPFAGRMLSDLGAEVVKVEPPDGDVTRIWGEERHGVGGFFQQQNAGKRNICIDMHADGSVPLILEMVKHADIVLENYRAGVMQRLGLGWLVLSQANPKLIMASISGFGQDGPESDRPAFAPVIEAEAGLIARQAQFDNAPPTDPMLSIADYNAALHALVGVLAALHAAKTTGVGTHIDIAMLDTLLATDDYIHHAIDDFPTVRLGGSYRRLPEGGWVLVSGQFKHIWHQLSTFKFVSDPSPKGIDLETKIANRERAVDEWWASLQTDAEACAALDKAKIAWGRMKTPEEALNSPTARHRGIVATVDDRGGGTRQVINSPYRYSAYESGVVDGAHHQGEDNMAVLNDWLGFSQAQVHALAAKGILK